MGSPLLQSNGIGNSALEKMRAQMSMRGQIEERRARQHHGEKAELESLDGSMSLSFLDGNSVSSPLIDTNIGDFNIDPEDDGKLFDFLL